MRVAASISDRSKKAQKIVLVGSLVETSGLGRRTCGCLATRESYELHSLRASNDTVLYSFITNVYAVFSVDQNAVGFAKLQ